VLSGGRRFFKRYFVLRDKVPEFRGWMDNDAVRELAATVINSLYAESPDYLDTSGPFGVNASETETSYTVKAPQPPSHNAGP
jgi:hypothetical protein